MWLQATMFSYNLSGIHTRGSSTKGYPLIFGGVMDWGITGTIGVLVLALCVAFATNWIVDRLLDLEKYLRRK